MHRLTSNPLARTPRGCQRTDAVLTNEANHQSRQPHRIRPSVTSTTAAIGKRGSCHRSGHTMAHTECFEHAPTIRTVKAMLAHAKLNTTESNTQVFHPQAASNHN